MEWNPWLGLRLNLWESISSILDPDLYLYRTDLYCTYYVCLFLNFLFKA